MSDTFNFSGDEDRIGLRARKYVSGRLCQLKSHMFACKQPLQAMMLCCPLVRSSRNAPLPGNSYGFQEATDVVYIDKEATLDA